MPVQRPRVRALDGSGELVVPAYELFSDTEVLGRMAMDRMLAGLSSRRYGVGLQPVGTRTEKAATSTSKSAVSRRFIAQTETALAELLAADLSSLDLVALMVDGVHFGEHPRDRHRGHKDSLSPVELADALPAGLGEAAAQIARETLAGAAVAAQQLPAGPAAELLDAARRAFTTGLGVAAAGGAVHFVGLAVLAAGVLRPAAGIANPGTHQAPPTPVQ